MATLARSRSRVNAFSPDPLFPLPVIQPAPDDMDVPLPYDPRELAVYYHRLIEMRIITTTPQILATIMLALEQLEEELRILEPTEARIQEHVEYYDIGQFGGEILDAHGVAELIRLIRFQA